MSGQTTAGRIDVEEDVSGTNDADDVMDADEHDEDGYS